MPHESPAARRARMGLPPHRFRGVATVDAALPSPEPAEINADVPKPAETSNAESETRPVELKPPKPRPQLNDLEREFLPPLLEIQETPPSPIQRKLLWTLIGLIFVSIVWASVGEISIVSTAPGKFIPDGRVKQVQPLESSVVKAIHIKEGQHVEQGQLLLELDTTLTNADVKANTDKYTLNQLDQSRLRAELNNTQPTYSVSNGSKEQIALAEQTRRAREQAYAAKLAQAQAEVAERASAIEAAQATLRKYQQTTQLAEEREASARPLLDIGAISRIDYLQLKQELVTNQNDLAAQEKALQQAEAAKHGAEQKLAQVQRDRITDIYSDLTQRVSTAPQLKSDLDKSQQLNDLKTIRAPVSGYVQKVEVTTLGQVVTPAQNLVTIVPDGTPLIVEATLSNQDIGYAKVGQPVEVKVDTFPFQKYGALKGTLIWISPDAEDRNAASNDSDTRSGSATSNANSNSLPNNAGYVYKVHIKPEQTTFIVDGKDTPIQAGMTVQADIVTDHRRVIEFFLSPVTKYLDEGLKVR